VFLLVFTAARTYLCSRCVLARLMVWTRSPKKRGVSSVGAEATNLRPVKRVKISAAVDGPCSRLRSGPVVRHPFIVEAATMQIDPLSRFALSPPWNQARHSPNSSVQLLASQDSGASSSDPSVLAVWSPSSYPGKNPSTPRPLGLYPPAVLPSAAPSTSPATTPTSSTVKRRLESSFAASGCTPSPIQPRSTISSTRPPHTPPAEMLLWLEGVFDSEGYDSETLELIARMQPRKHRHVSGPARHAMVDPVPSTTSSPSVSPGSQQPSEVWISEDWPDDVKPLKEHWNPNCWKFALVSISIRGGAGCGCEERCNVSTCANAKENRFCVESNCSFAGCCGNALKENPSLVIARSSLTGMRGVAAKYAIAAGEVRGAYLTHLDLFGPPCRNGPVNDGFRMHLKTRTSGRKYVGIDAKEMGGTLRFMNHACNPCARFHEVQTGTRLTVVGVTVRDTAAGEQVIVSYGDCLWFICRCGWSGCQYRDLQDLPDLDGSAN
jgi:hypothetical protein